MATAKTPASPATTTAKKPVARKASPKAPAVVSQVKEEASSGSETFANKATDKAREYANVGKDKASGALDEISQMVEGVARTIDEKVGTQYGDYARRAAGAVSGVADALKGKEVDELVDDARTFIRDKPAVAIGAAAAIGFVLTRLLKAGSGDKTDA